MVNKIKGITLIGCLLALSGCNSNNVSLSGTKLDYQLIDESNFDNNNYYMNKNDAIHAADPWVIQADGKYYAYATSDKLSNYGFLVWESDNMVDWEEVGIAHYMSKDGWAVRDYWAPEVTYYNDKYYMHYTAKDKDGVIKIGMAVADTPVGPFEDVSDEAYFYPGYNIIDSNILISDEGNYLYYSRDCSEYVYQGRNESHIYGVELDDELNVVGEPTLLIKPDLAWEQQSGNTRWTEAPEIIQHQDQYYLIYSANLFNSREYSLGYAVADNPLGPFEKPDTNRVLYAPKDWDHVSGPGHNSFTTSLDDEEQFTLYHSHVNTAGGGVRKLNIDRFGFRQDGSFYVNGPTITPQPMPSGAGKLVSKNKMIKALSIDETSSPTLYDQEFFIYDENSNFIQVKNQTINVEFNEAVTISDIMLYANKGDEIKIAGIQLGEENYLKDLEYQITYPGEAMIINFEPVTTNSITIYLDNESNIDLSEINFLGNKD